MTPKQINPITILPLFLSLEFVNVGFPDEALFKFLFGYFEVEDDEVLALLFFE